MDRFACLLILPALLSNIAFGASSPTAWGPPPPGLSPELRKIHVVSSATKTSGSDVVRYEVDAWYFDSEMVARIRSANSDMIGFEDKAKSQAAYWEKKIDTSTGFFPKEFLDGYITDLVAHAYIWLYQAPIRKIMRPTAARTESDIAANLTTVTLRIPHPFNSSDTYRTTTYRNDLITLVRNSGTFGGVVQDVSWVDYANNDAKTSLPRIVTKHNLTPPYRIISHQVKSIENIPLKVTAKEILNKITPGYRSISISMLNDPAERSRRPAGNTSFSWLRVCGVLAAIGFLAFGLRGVLRNGR